MARAQRGFSSLLSATWFIRQASARGSLTKLLLIEKSYRLNPKVLLYSRNVSSYGPTITRLATKLRQTKGGVQ